MFLAGHSWQKASCWKVKIPVENATHRFWSGFDLQDSAVGYQTLVGPDLEVIKLRRVTFRIMSPNHSLIVSLSQRMLVIKLKHSFILSYPEWYSIYLHRTKMD